jgi:hypothetical protein
MKCNGCGDEFMFLFEGGLCDSCKPEPVKVGFKKKKQVRRQFIKPTQVRSNRAGRYIILLPNGKYYNPRYPGRCTSKKNAYNFTRPSRVMPIAERFGGKVIKL